MTPTIDVPFPDQLLGSRVVIQGASGAGKTKARPRRRGRRLVKQREKVANGLAADMRRPVRLQLSRAKGFNLQAHSRVVNGLQAIHCARPGPWGNPFPWRGGWITWAAVAAGFRADRAGRTAAAVAFHREWITGGKASGPLAGSKNGSVLEYESGIALDTADVARGIASQMAWIERNTIRVPAPPSIEAIRAALRGKNLACWCGLDEPHCHVDLLLALANQDR